MIGKAEVEGKERAIALRAQRLAEVVTLSPVHPTEEPLNWRAHLWQRPFSSEKESCVKSEMTTWKSGRE